MADKLRRIKVKRDRVKTTGKKKKYKKITLPLPKTDFYKQQQNSLLLLSGWSATNLVASPVFCKNLYR